MLLIELKRSMSDEEWATFATDCGTTPGHLRNVAYGTATANASLTRQVFERTNGTVKVWDLRPDDWWKIWPELCRTKGAPLRNAQAKERV